MAERYFREPYRFIAPFRSKFWCRVVTPIMPARIRRHWQVARWEFRGIGALERAIERKRGILLAPNHCRDADSPVMALASVEVGHYFYYLASYHLFKRSAFTRWFLNRMGGFSILREGSDREAIRASVSILSDAERPLVLFPEGTWFRQNDKLGPLQEGVGLIVRQAAKRSKNGVYVFPVAIKYWYLEDPQPIFAKRLAQLEKVLHWDSREHESWVDRIARLSSGLLAVKEIEFFGEPQQGTLRERRDRFVGAVLDHLEAKYADHAPGTLHLERIRAVRQRVVQRMNETGKHDPMRTECYRQLNQLLICENIASHDQQYLASRPSYERIGEAIQRIEETLTDLDVPLAPMGVVVQFGEPLNAADFLGQRSGREDPFIKALSTRIQSQLDALTAEGPPPGWKCPPPLERM